jgi:hypothetical protein
LVDCHGVVDKAIEYPIVAFLDDAIELWCAKWLIHIANDDQL